MAGGRGIRGEGEGGPGRAGEVPQGPRARTQEAPDGGIYLGYSIGIATVVYPIFPEALHLMCIYLIF